MKRKILKKSLIAGLAISVTLATTIATSVVITTSFSTSKSPSSALTTFSSTSLIAKKETNYISSNDGSSFFTTEGNKIISYSKNALEQFTITLEENTKVASLETFEIADNTYLAAITSKNKLLVYNLEKPNVPEKSFDIHQNLDKMAKNENYLYLFSSQNSLGSFSSYKRLNLKTMELEDLRPPAIENPSNVFLASMVSVYPNVNVLVYLTVSGFASQSISSSTNFRSATYVFVDDNMNKIDRGIAPSEGVVNFPAPLAFNQINTTVKKNNNNHISASDIAAFVTLGTRVLIVKTSLETELVSTPSNKAIHSVVYNDHISKFIFNGDNLIYNLNTRTNLFFVNQPLPSIGETSAPENYSLVDVNDDNAFIVAGHNSIKTINKFFGISPNEGITPLEDTISFGIYSKTTSYPINDSISIPILASSLRMEDINVINNVSSIPYILVGDLKYLELEMDPEKTNTSAKVEVGLAATSWFDQTKTIITKKVLDIKNFSNLKDVYQNSWIDQIAFNNALNISVQQLPKYLGDTIKPLNIEKWNNDVLKIQSAEYFVESVNASGDILNISAFVTYLNLVDNSYYSFKASRNYLVDISTEKIFQLYGEMVDGKIDIASVIAESSGRVDQSIRNFLPSYAFRSSSSNVNPSVNDLESFYFRFIKKASNIIVSVVAENDDEKGTMKLTFNLDQNVLGRHGEFSSITITYTGMKKLSDFFVSFDGKSSDDRVDFQSVTNLSEAQKNASPYTLVTGYDLRNLLYADSPLTPTTETKRKLQAQKNMELLLKTNMHLMKFSPVFEVTTLKSKDDLIKSIVDGTLELKVSYPNITEALRVSLGLDENFSKKVTFFNLPPIDKLFNFQFNEELSNEIIASYDVDEELTQDIKKEILKSIEALGYKKADATYEIKWVNQKIVVTITLKDNNLNGDLNILPKTYTLELSWFNKTFPAYLTKVLFISIPSGIVLIIIIAVSIVIYVRKTRLRKYF